MPGFNSVMSFTESTTPLGISATFSGPARENSGYAKFRALATADQSGTLNLQQSKDGATNFRTTKTVAVVANTPVTLEDIIVARFVRVQLVNGATGQGSLELLSALVAI